MKAGAPQARVAAERERLEAGLDKAEAALR
jgi:hypothetical protein